MMQLKMQLKPYPKYKDSSLEWVGEIPDHWRVVPIFACAKVKKDIGEVNRELLSVYLNKGVIKFSDVTEKRTNVTSEDLSKYQAVDLGDFVLNNQQAWRGSVGVSKYSGLVSPAYLVLELDNSIDFDFANYLFRNRTMVIQYLINSKGVGTIQRNLYWPHLKRSLTFFPPIEEQELIVRYLNYINSRISKYIAAKNKLIKLLEEQKQAIIHQAVTGAIDVRTGKPYPKYKESGLRELSKIPINWGILPFKHCVKFINDCLANNTHPEYGFKYLDISTVSTGYLRRDPEFILFKNAPSRARKIPQKYDTILSNVRTYLKSIYYFKDEPIDTIVSTGFSILRPRRILNSEYLPVLAQAAFFTDEVIKNSTGTAYPAINETKLGAIKVPIPPQNTQDEIVTYTNRLNTSYSVLTSQCKTEIELLIEFRTRLTADVVTGKIDVRVAAEDLPEKFEGVIDDVNEETIDENDDISDVEESYE